MDSKRVFATLGPALLLLACEQRQSPREDANSAATAPPTPQPVANTEAVASLENTPASGANGTVDGNPDLAPPRLVPEAKHGVAGARNILLSFARAIEQREYEQAWALLSPADKRKWSSTDFAAMFADLGETSVAIPDGTMEGAAGSLFYTAPVTITGNDRQGRPVRVEGQAVLQRVNDVEGASPAQLRWHFETLTLD